MKITCMGCQNYEFEIKISDLELEETLQVSLKCPNCNKRTLLEPLYKGEGQFLYIKIKITNRHNIRNK